MNAFWDAVDDRLAETSLAPAVHWGLATSEAMAAIARQPYVVVDPGGGLLPDYDSGGNAIEPRMLSLKVLSISKRLTTELLRELEGAFVLQEMSLASGGLLLCTKGSDGLFLDPDRAPDGEEVWMGVLGLEFLVQRAPGEG